MFPELFYVHRNGAPQQLYHGQYNRIMFTHANRNDNNNFDLSLSRWIAPADGALHISGQLMYLGGLAIGPQIAIKFILNSTTGGPPPQVPNGSDMFSPVTMTVAGNPAADDGDGWWHVSAGDKVELATQTSCPGNTGVVDGHRAHSYCSGAFFRSDILQRIAALEARVAFLESSRTGKAPRQ